MTTTPHAVQFGIQTDGRLDFTCRDADSLEDAMGHIREAVATHPDFKWDVVMIWPGKTVAEIQAFTEEDST